LSFALIFPQVSLAVPETFEESYLRVYIRDASDPEKMQAAEQAFKSWLRKHQQASPHPGFNAKRTSSFSSIEEDASRGSQPTLSHASPRAANRSGVWESPEPRAQNALMTSQSPCPTPAPPSKRQRTGTFAKNLSFPESSPSALSQSPPTSLSSSLLATSVALHPFMANSSSSSSSASRSSTPIRVTGFEEDSVVPSTPEMNYEEQ